MKTIMIFIILMNISSYSQVIITNDNSSPLIPNDDAILELKGNKGFLLPRVALESTNSATPLNSHTPGMMLYNTSSTNDITPGFYYDDGLKWNKLEERTQFDNTNDAFVNNSTNSRVELSTLSDGKTTRTNPTQMMLFDNGNVAIGKNAAGQEVDINGTIRIENLPSAVTENTGKIVVDPAGRFYNLYIPGGSASASFQSVASGVLTVNSSATVVWNAGGGNIILPNPSTSIGRKLSMIAAGTSCNINYNLITGNGTTISTIPGQKRTTVIALNTSAGSNWYIVNKDF